MATDIYKSTTLTIGSAFTPLATPGSDTSIAAISSTQAIQLLKRLTRVIIRRVL